MVLDSILLQRPLLWTLLPASPCLEPGMNTYLAVVIVNCHCDRHHCFIFSCFWYLLLLWLSSLLTHQAIVVTAVSKAFSFLLARSSLYFWPQIQNCVSFSRSNFIQDRCFLNTFALNLLSQFDFIHPHLHLQGGRERKNILNESDLLFVSLFVTYYPTALKVSKINYSRLINCS